MKIDGRTDFGINRNGGLCECGCGALAPIAKRTRGDRGWIKGKRVRYIQGHNKRKGWTTDKNGYYLLRLPDHPNARADGYILRSHYVVSEIIGRPIASDERVDHMDGDISNDHPMNLILFESQGDHMREHGLRRRRPNEFDAVVRRFKRFNPRAVEAAR
jgi:hypothetical protein